MDRLENLPETMFLITKYGVYPADFPLNCFIWACLKMVLK
jgi:hypothetical protein